MKEIGRIFLLTWKFFTSKVIREFTLTSAPSFGKPQFPYPVYMHQLGGAINSIVHIRVLHAGTCISLCVQVHVHVYINDRPCIYLLCILCN